MNNPLSLYQVMRRPGYDAKAINRAMIRFLGLSDDERAAELQLFENDPTVVEFDEMNSKFLDIAKKLHELSPERREYIAVNMSMHELDSSIQDLFKGWL